jgi:hypothetical protein
VWATSHLNLSRFQFGIRTTPSCIVNRENKARRIRPPIIHSTGGGEEATQSVPDPIEFSGASCQTAAIGILAGDPRWVSCSGSGRRPPVRFPRSSPEIPASNFDRILLTLVLACGSLFRFYVSSKGNSFLRWIDRHRWCWVLSETMVRRRQAIFFVTEVTRRVIAKWLVLACT